MYIKLILINDIINYIKSKRRILVYSLLKCGLAKVAMDFKCLTIFAYVFK